MFRSNFTNNEVNVHVYFGSEQHFFSADHGIINGILLISKFNAKLWALKIHLYRNCTETNHSNKTKILFKSHVKFYFVFFFIYAVFSILPICHKKGLVDQPSCNKTDDTSTMQFWRLELYQLGTCFFFKNVLCINVMYSQFRSFTERILKGTHFA